MLRNDQNKRIKLNYNYDSVLKSIKSIEERNNIFNNLTPIEQRKEIAWDSLILITTNQVGASYGCYWDSFLQKNKE